MRKLILILIFFTSCKCSDIDNVIISGVVKDQNLQPISNAIIVAENYFCGNSPDESYGEVEYLDTKTDSLGFYSITIKKSVFISIGANKGLNFSKETFSKEILLNNYTINFKLINLKQKRRLK